MTLLLKAFIIFPPVSDPCIVPLLVKLLRTIEEPLLPALAVLVVLDKVTPELTTKSSLLFIVTVELVLSEIT